MIPGSAALAAVRGEGDGKPWRPGTWPGAGPTPLGAMPAEKLRTDAALDTGLQDSRRLPGAQCIFPEHHSRTEGERPPRGTRSHAPPPPREGGLGLQRWPPRARLGPTRGGRRRRRQKPRDSPAGLPQKLPGGLLATVTQPARRQQDGRGGALRAALGGRGPGGAGIAGESGCQPPVSIRVHGAAAAEQGRSSAARSPAAGRRRGPRRAGRPLGCREASRSAEPRPRGPPGPATAAPAVASAPRAARGRVRAGGGA